MLLQASNSPTFQLLVAVQKFCLHVFGGEKKSRYFLSNLIIFPSNDVLKSLRICTGITKELQSETYQILATVQKLLDRFL